MNWHCIERTPGALALACVLLAGCGGGGDDIGSGYTAPPATTSERYRATLSGANEAPPNTSMASGAATASVDTASKAMTVSVSTTGVAGTAAHVHEGAAGVAGPVVFPLAETAAGSGAWQTTVTLSDAQLTSLRGGMYYVNVHSAAYPAGEIRDQLRAY